MKIGILGAGQLARMLALAGHPLGLETVCFTELAMVPAACCAKLVVGRFDDQSALQHFAQQVDVITFENENIDVNVVEFLSGYCPVYPTSAALALTQDRLLEKQLLQQLEIPVGRCCAIHSLAELEKNSAAFNHDAILKTRRFGYDGKGQWRIRSLDDLAKIKSADLQEPLILEEFIPFDEEVSMIAVRSLQGQIKFYPLTKNVHHQGILKISVAPANSPLENLARDYMARLLTHFNYVGVLAIEFFCKGEQLLANEIAPRVHNSGHWTQNGAVTSQFENHMRAMAQLPLGETTLLAKTAMFNCIGSEPLMTDVLQIPYTHYHHYGKEARALRKLAHINLTYQDDQQFERGYQQLIDLLA
jgi:5-(carboxyamino)imidazole ribonucleotide synthase